MTWGVKWRSENKLDGRQEYLIGTRYQPECAAGGYTTAVFRTREDARSFIRKKFGYIKDRPDLRAEPHGWKMPVAVKVIITVKEWK